MCLIARKRHCHWWPCFLECMDCKGLEKGMIGWVGMDLSRWNHTMKFYVGVVIPPSLEKKFGRLMLRWRWIFLDGVRPKKRFALRIWFGGRGSLSIGVVCAKGTRRQLIIFAFIVWWRGSSGLWCLLGLDWKGHFQECHAASNWVERC